MVWTLSIPQRSTPRSCDPLDEEVLWIFRRWGQVRSHWGGHSKELRGILSLVVYSGFIITVSSYMYLGHDVLLNFIFY